MWPRPTTPIKIPTPTQVWIGIYLSQDSVSWETTTTALLTKMETWCVWEDSLISVLKTAPVTDHPM